jgi:hypothetical protein
MARAFTSGSQQWLSTASAPVTDVPLTLCCWAKCNAQFAGLVSVGAETSATSGHYYRLSVNTDGTVGAFSAAGAAIAANAAATTSSFTNGTWFHAAGVFSADNSRTVYLNAGSSVSNTNSVNVDPSLVTEVRIGRRHLLIGNETGFFTGDIAEVGIWNAALTAAEIASLADGMTCDKVRPNALVAYFPLIRDLNEIRGGLAVTNNNSATVANHPRVYA